MKICWLGWKGPYMDEVSLGLLKIDPDMLYYVIGRNGKQNIWPSKNVKRFVDKDTLFRDLAAFDIIIYDTYIFSMGDGGADLESFLPKDESITQYEEWGWLEAKKVLLDAESISGKLPWFAAHAKFFDHVITNNPDMPGFYTYFMSAKTYENTGPNNEIKVLYTGSFINTEYRKELADLIYKDPKNVVAGWVHDEEAWLKMLNRSKMYLATYSCASGPNIRWG